MCMLSMLRITMQSSEKLEKLKFSKCSLGVKALVKCVETSCSDIAMSKDTGELISVDYVVSLILAIP